MVRLSPRAAATALLLAGLAGTSSASEAASALAQIDLSADADTLTLTTSVLAVADTKGTAELRVRRSGKGGVVNSIQSQAFDLAAGERGEIARLSLSLAPGDALLVEAILRSGNAVISTTRLETGEVGLQ